MNLTFSQDPYRMNWMRSDFPYAHLRFAGRAHPLRELIPDPLEAEVTTTSQGDEWHTVVELRNTGTKPYVSRAGDVGITLPLQDRYDLAADQVHQRCNAHLFCAGSSSFVVALRMGGESPHLGLVLTEGELRGYSIERDVSLSSNDRGCFVLHPGPLELQPGETTRVAWRIFPFDDLEDFYARAAALSRFVRVSWDSYVLFPGERSTLVIEPSFDAESVTVNGHRVAADADGRYRYEFAAAVPGEHVFHVDADGRTVTTRLLVKVGLDELVENRCRFIVEHQQYAGPLASLQGALLAYDNEERRVVYDAIFDLNGGRERVGMGLLLARYLMALGQGQLTASHDDTEAMVRAGLDDYVAYVKRELVDPESGAVFNDIGRDDSFTRLYNPPWYATFFMTLYALDGDVEDLRIAVRILSRFYADGGADFYPLAIPILEMCTALEKVGWTEDLERMRAAFLEHAQHVVAVGTSYPPIEVNYEQSIVAPAVEILLQTALATGDQRLVEAAKPHVMAMEQFQGMQPDHHLNEVAIRHWDGFWFGKSAQFGDTFPHYWSALTGNAFELLHQITGDTRYAERAGASFRGVLPLIFDDGRASCAYVFPFSVNGQRGTGYDAYANDQDWGLYFSVRRIERVRQAAVSRAAANSVSARPAP